MEVYCVALAKLPMKDIVKIRAFCKFTQRLQIYLLPVMIFVKSGTYFMSILYITRPKVIEMVGISKYRKKRLISV